MRSIEEKFVQAGQMFALKLDRGLRLAERIAVLGCRRCFWRNPRWQPGWEVDSHAFPTNLKPGGMGILVVDVYNIGEGASAGTVTVVDKLAGRLGSRRSAGALGPYGGLASVVAEVEISEEEAETIRKT